MELVTRQDAIEQGLPKYFTGIPCKRGHLSERRTLLADCIECRRAKAAYIIERQKARKKRLADAAVAEAAA